jgi:hypothetical protein
MYDEKLAEFSGSKRLNTHTQNKNIMGLYTVIFEFKKRYQPTTDVVYENDNLLSDIHIILKEWKNYLFYLVNVRGINDVKQTDMHTGEPLVLEHYSFEVPIEKMTRYKFSRTDQILTVLIQAADLNSRAF